MKQQYALSKRFLLPIVMGISLSGNLVAQNCYDPGTGADGAYSSSGNGTLAGGTYNYTTFTIAAGDTIRVTGTAPMVIHCTGAVLISGVLMANGGNGGNGVTSSNYGAAGVGVAGGGNGGHGSYSQNIGPLVGIAGTGPGGAGNQGDGWSGGGGAGYSVAGNASGNSAGGFGGPAYGNPAISGLEPGSGGGGGSGGYTCGGGGGGAGGGIIVIQSGASITIASSGKILCNGGNGGTDGGGNCGGGGGGSGGSISLVAPSMTHNGSLSAIGGTGGGSTIPGNPYYGVGANGADGRIRLDYNGNLSGSGSNNPAVGFHSAILTATVTLPADTICQFANPLTLSGGSPAGGTYSGPGVSGGVFDPAIAGGGLQTITYTYYDSATACGISNTDVIFVEMCVGINDPIAPGFAVNVLPNPNNGNFTIAISHATAETQFTLCNELGQVIDRFTVAAGTSSIQMNQLAKGFYLLTAENAGTKTVRRIIVQ